MTCPQCGSAIEQGARFCGVCGHRVEASAAAPARVKETAPRGGARTPLRPATPIPDPATAAPPPPPTASQPSSPARPASPSAASSSRTLTSPEKPRAAQSGSNRKVSEKLSEIAIVPAAGGDDPYIGTTLNGRFTVEKKLGEGGFGAVYNGVQLLTGRKVAIKLLHPEMTRDQNVVARFRREGQVLCSLRDAHTITTYDFDQTADGTLFIAMELLEGRSLHDVFHDEAPIAWQRMLKIMSEMCSSLEEAHTLGIVHRDLKPENIYLEHRPGNPEFVKILDFGIAKVMRGDGGGIGGDMSPQLTATGQTLGTLEYMSPEQLMGKPLDGRSDIYGLGVVAFEMLTGRLPFPDAVGPAALISAQLKKTPPTPSKINTRGSMPPEVDSLILKMLAKDKNQRFRDAAELRSATEDVLSTLGRPSSSRAASSPSSPAPSSGSGRTPSSPPPASSSRAQPPSQPPPSGPGAAERQARSSWVVPSHAPHATSSGPVMSGGGALGSTPGPHAPGNERPGQVPHEINMSPAVITARSAAPPPAVTRGQMPVAPVASAPPVTAGIVSPGHTDPPWAGHRPVGSSISPGSPGRPRASAGPASAVERERDPAPIARPGAGSTPWMWIAVAAILFLAIVIGGILALR
ncbi:MAG TPA: protein kinase [Kofleriaceae bacterium]|nr:protein kinase [Kofleriaceae bacterium]